MEEQRTALRDVYNLAPTRRFPTRGSRATRCGEISPRTEQPPSSSLPSCVHTRPSSSSSSILQYLIAESASKCQSTTDEMYGAAACAENTMGTFVSGRSARVPRGETPKALNSAKGKDAHRNSNFARCSSATFPRRIYHETHARGPIAIVRFIRDLASGD